MAGVRLRVGVSLQVAALVAGCAHGESTPATKDATAPAPVVRALTIEGADQVSAQLIRKRILTTKTKPWPFAAKKRFDPIAWETDLQRIVRLYRARGYYQARVADARVAPVPDGVALWVRVVEGEPTRIQRIDLAGLDELPAEHREEALDDLPLKLKDVFREDRWEAAKEQLRSRLRELGYAQVKVAGHAVVDLEHQSASLALTVDPGLRYRFGEVTARVPPGSAAQPQWIADEVRLAIGRDEFFSDHALAEAQRRVFNMGVFSTVRVSPGAPDVAGRIPVMVDVQEAPFRTLRLGAGLGFDQIRQELRLRGEWTHRNFQGGLRRLTLRAQAGWAFIPSVYDVIEDVQAKQPRNGPFYLAGVDFEQPRIFGGPRFRLLSGLESERRLEQAYTSIAVRTMVGLGWRPRSTVSLLGSYHIEGARLDGPPVVDVRSAPLTLGCSENPCFVLLSYLEQTITWDRRDDMLSPTAGTFLGLSLQEGGGPLGGDFRYLRVLPDVRVYVTPDEERRFTIAARARVGLLAPASGRDEDSPVVQRFYGGGAVSMRGFNARRLSPLLIVPAPTAPNQPPVLVALPIGGNGLLEGSLEVRYRLGDTLTLAAFLDAGDVTRGRPTLDDLRGLLYAVGIGVRISTPVGPIRIDLARRLQLGTLPAAFDIAGDRVSYEPDTSCFGFGGSGRETVVRDGLCVLHVSIGEAF